MLVGPLRPAPNPQTMLGKPVENLADAGRLLLDHLMRAAADGRELFVGSHARSVAPPHLGRPPLHKPRHAHQKELIEVRSDDRQKLQPLQKRQVRIEPFLQHAMVELQPAQLAVDEQIRRFQGVFWHGLVRSDREIVNPNAVFRDGNHHSLRQFHTTTVED